MNAATAPRVGLPRMISITTPPARDWQGKDLGSLKVTMSVHRAVAHRDLLAALPFPSREQEAMLEVLVSAIAADGKGAP